MMYQLLKWTYKIKAILCLFFLKAFDTCTLLLFFPPCWVPSSIFRCVVWWAHLEGGQVAVSRPNICHSDDCIVISGCFKIPIQGKSMKKSIMRPLCTYACLKSSIIVCDYCAWEERIAIDNTYGFLRILRPQSCIAPIYQ